MPTALALLEAAYQIESALIEWVRIYAAGFCHESGCGYFDQIKRESLSH